MRNFISTPNLGLKRKLAERFKIYSIDEFRTSKLCYKNESECENLYLPDVEGNIRKLHPVLTYRIGSETGCINRDKNAVNNFRKLTEHWLKTGERMKEYTRQER